MYAKARLTGGGASVGVDVIQIFPGTVLVVGATLAISPTAWTCGLSACLPALGVSFFVASNITYRWRLPPRHKHSQTANAVARQCRQAPCWPRATTAPATARRSAGHNTINQQEYLSDWTQDDGGRLGYEELTFVVGGNGRVSEVQPGAWSNRKLKVAHKVHTRCTQGAHKMAVYNSFVTPHFLHGPGTCTAAQPPNCTLWHL